MYHKSILCILYTVSILLIAACKKDDNKPDPIKPDTGNTKKEWLTKVWHVHQVLHNQTDQTPQFAAYQMEFKNNGSYTFGKTGDLVQGTWEFNSHEQKMLFDKGTADEEIVSILLLTQTDLHLEYTEPANGKTGEQKIVFKFK